MSRIATPRAERQSPARTGRLQIASVSTVLPSAEEPQHGIFVRRRIEAMAEFADVRALKPIPWFPLLRPRPSVVSAGEAGAGPKTQPLPMFYFPGVLKRLDGRWLERSVYPILREWKEELGIDLVDAHFGYPEGVGCVRAARRLGLPVFITMRGSEEDWLPIRSVRGPLLDALKTCSGIIAVSHSLRDLALRYGVEADKIAVIPNAVDDSVFHPGNQIDARRECGVPADRPTIVSVGRLSRRKGHHVLIEALGRLSTKHPDVNLMIVGGSVREWGYPAGFLGNLAETCGVGDRVHLLGKLAPHEVATWLRAADLFALASDCEGCCNAVLESMACGTPVVATDVGDNSVYVEEPVHGYVVPVEDVEAMAGALDRALGQSWDSGKIVSRVTSGGWSSVARDVTDFFQERLAIIGENE